MANIIRKSEDVWEVFFEGMPDWAIPLIKVVPEFYTSDEYTERWNDLYFNFHFYYVWEKVDTNNYKLYIQIGNYLKERQEDTVLLPLFVDLNLWFINTNIRTDVQHNLGY